MKRTVTAMAGILALVLLVGTTCFGVELPQSFPAGDGFTMHLPENWKPIPKNVLDTYSRAIAKMAPKAEKQSYDYGFQRADTPKWFTYPYILVQVKRSGRIPEEQLEALKRIEKAMDDSFAKAKDSLSSFTSNASIGEPLYDPATHILWTRVAIDVKETGTVRGIVGVILTTEGFIQIACYAKDVDFTEYLPLFETVINTTEISDKMKYSGGTTAETGETAGSEQSAVSLGTIALVFAGAMLIVIGWRASRRKSGDS